MTVPINIPWANRNELDRYKNALKQYKNELDNAMKNLCVNAENTKACLDAKASLNAGGLMSSIITNLKRLEEYERFPEKIQKYITWKERYIAQILCNVDAIQSISTRWIKDNGIRFRKWAELYVLVKAIASGWQPLLDIFNDTRASCSVCRNQRYDLTYWRLKLISVMLPTLPVIRFPKWPDLILDLSDIRFGINISMPVFDPRVSPIKFPDVPRFAIGDIHL